VAKRIWRRWLTSRRRGLLKLLLKCLWKFHTHSVKTVAQDIKSGRFNMTQKINGKHAAENKHFQVTNGDNAYGLLLYHVFVQIECTPWDQTVSQVCFIEPVIAGLTQQSLQLQAQAKLTSLGWCNNSRGCAKACALRSECSSDQSGGGASFCSSWNRVIKVGGHKFCETRA
jgi:hypothetical protein